MSAVVQFKQVPAPVPPKPTKRGKAVAVFCNGVAVVGDMTQKSFTQFAADLQTAMTGKGRDE